MARTVKEYWAEKSRSFAQERKIMDHLVDEVVPYISMFYGTTVDIGYEQSKEGLDTKISAFRKAYDKSELVEYGGYFSYVKMVYRFENFPFDVTIEVKPEIAEPYIERVSGGKCKVTVSEYTSPSTSVCVKCDL